MLSVNTQLRQGCVLINKDAGELGLIGYQETDKKVVVISHDCDLANKDEKFIEVIVARVLQHSVNIYENAQNPRQLHLKYFKKVDNKEQYLGLTQVDKQQVDKNKFDAIINNIDSNMVLEDKEKRILKQWLAARYGRPAFPNSFENRLRKKNGKENVKNLIAKTLKPNSKYLVGLFFDLEEDRFNELTDVPYNLSIFVVYDATDGGENARKAADTIADDIKELFHQAYGKPGTATEIALEKCTAIADTYFSLADLRRMDQWSLEYISLSEQPVEEFIGAGSIY